MKQYDEMTVYEAVDTVKEIMTAGKLADYLYMNYPDYAEDLMNEIQAIIYLEIMDSIEDSNENR